MRGRPTRDPHTRPAMNTLERLHMELAGQLLNNKQQHDELAAQMRQVEAVIKMLDPTYNLRAIAVKRRKQNQWFKRGTLYRHAMDVLRAATAPMTAPEIAKAVLVKEGIETDDTEAVAALANSVLSSLRNHRGGGVRQVNEGMTPARWEITR